MKVKDYYQGKCLLITGCTGFLGILQFLILNSKGKVVLEKILRSLDVKKIYLLIRPKTGVSVMERVKKEIFQSPIFDLLKRQYDDFMAIVDEKIIPVEGDISEPQLIFNQEKLAEIIENVQVIINNAASIDFNLRLDQAIQINYFGPLRLLALAKRCKQVDVFTHVSTAYVNSEKQGFIDEKIYDYPNDPDETIERLQKLSEKDILENTKEIITPWANTYTFTKNLAERALQKHRENFPVLILRPAIIICAHSQPFPGWIDSLAAAGALTLFVSMGAVHYAAGSQHVRGDIIPVDFVGNAIIVGTAFQAKQNSLSIQHCNTSHANSITWQSYGQHVLAYSKTQPMEQQVGSLRFQMVPEKRYNQLFYLENVLPAKILAKMSNYVGTQEWKRNVQRMNKLNDKIAQVQGLLKTFTMTDWCFESKRVFEIYDKMDPEEKISFNFNPKTIEWGSMCFLMAYGIQKYMMKMDVPLPNDQSNLLHKLNVWFFEDSSIFLSKTNKIRSQNLDYIVERVLFSDRVQSELRRLSQNQSSTENYYTLMKESKAFLSSMSSQINRQTLQAVFLVFHQRFKKIFDQIIVSDQDLKQLAQYQQTKGKSVVLIPSFKSYLDFILLAYIHIIYQLDLPFIFGLVEFSDITVVTKLLRACGGFFIDQKRLNQTLPRLLLEEFLSQIVKNQHTLGYHIERRRERSGKIVKPIEFILEQVLDTHLKNPEEVEDLLLVPITINYDKIYEGQQFPYELLGEEHKRESVLKMLRNIFWVSEQYGKVHVKHSKPISLREKASEYLQARNLDRNLLYSTPNSQTLHNEEQIARSEQVKKEFTQHLSMELVYTLSDNLVIMSTNIVAAMLLLKRQGGITEEELLKKIGWLYDEILARGANTSLNSRPTKTTLKNSLSYLQKFIDMKKDVFSPQVKANKDYKNILMLAYYRNNLIHLFLNEAYIATSLLAFGESTAASQQGVSLQRLWEQTDFLTSVLRDEFVVRDQIASYEDFFTTLKFMEKRGYLEIFNVNQQQQVKLTKPGKFAHRFFASLIQPFVESYWVTLSFFKQMKPSQTLPQALIERRIQWLAETLYDEGFLIFYESCSLEPIGNSIQRFATMGVIGRRGQPFSLINQFPEVHFFMGEDKKDFAQVKQLYERLTFFKPTLTLITGIINFEDDVKRILSKAPTEQNAKL